MGASSPQYHSLYYPNQETVNISIQFLLTYHTAVTVVKQKNLKLYNNKSYLPHFVMYSSKSKFDTEIILLAFYSSTFTKSLNNILHLKFVNDVAKFVINNLY